MKPKTIEEVLEDVKTWPEIAQADLAQAALGIEADLESGAYGEKYKPTPEEAAVLEWRIKEYEGAVEPVSYEECKVALRQVPSRVMRSKSCISVMPSRAPWEGGR
jgi:hypothetical protein